MADEDRVKLLVKEVEEKTTAGVLRWLESADMNEFVSVMPGGKFTIKAVGHTDFGYDNEPDGNACLLLCRRADDLQLLKITGSSPGVFQGKLDRIYLLAREKALGIDDAVDEIIAGLDEI